MPGDVAEALDNQATQQAAANKQGVEAISLWQTITFTKYTKLVLPLDGFVFWVNAGIVNNQSSTFNAGQFNSFDFNQGPTIALAPTTQTVKGSLHYDTTANQEEDENLEINAVRFTAESEIQAFNQIAPDEMWLGTIDNIRFAFTSRSTFYRQAGLWHYIGDAVYPDMETQIIDSPNQINASQAIVSNSLPLWLVFNGFDPQPWDYLTPGIPLYPSFLSPENLRPPFATVHIDPDTTEALQAAPFLGKRLSHYQLCKEKVRITFWGCNNQAVLQFIDFVNNYSVNNPGSFGILNMPVPKDQKRTQAELGTIAQKKTVDFSISYYQQAARDVARLLIKTVIVDYIPQ